MTVQRLPLSSLLAQPLTFVLCPPALRFYLTHSLVLLASLLAVGAALWDGQSGFGLIHWVGILFGGTVLLLSLWPPSWSRQRLINLAFDEQQLYLVNGLGKQAVALPRERVCAVNKGKLPGHDGAIIAFTLDLALNDAELALVQETLGTQVEDRFKLEEDRYRFGFVGNWQNRRQLLAAVSVLAPAVITPAAVADEDDDDEWDD
ncbi:hypothetical protein GCM10011502_09460 [Oceanisphaera marina]|uniref:Uncharacterized protein n=1 Tax=Oceanisphaera marina TaxID=2017550 RepID=A0ABQ1IHJ6_9GAMM|nr:hypothetical protein [Oceanisphaera marina]GGB38297.1 hypothetical protein GCM10011502_09460 [Oceanisphaera marina]